MSKGKFLGEFEILVLGALLRLGDHAYGVRVRQEIEARADREVSIGAVYTTLGRLEDKGHGRSWLGEPSESRGGRAKRFFKPTAQGARALRRSIRSIDRIVGDLAVEWNRS